MDCFYCHANRVSYGESCRDSTPVLLKNQWVLWWSGWVCKGQLAVGWSGDITLFGGPLWIHPFLFLCPLPLPLPELLGVHWTYGIRWNQNAAASTEKLWIRCEEVQVLGTTHADQELDDWLPGRFAAASRASIVSSARSIFFECLDCLV